MGRAERWRSRSERGWGRVDSGEPMGLEEREGEELARPRGLPHCTGGWGRGGGERRRPGGQPGARGPGPAPVTPPSPSPEIPLPR